MKKLCLAVVLVFLGYVNNVKADTHGEFIRIECNKTLGFFEIREETIFGEQANDFFDENDSHIKYSSDNEKFKNEVYWVNSWAHTEEKGPFVCRCQISDTLAYDIEIETMRRGDCNYRANTLVNITEINSNAESGEVKEQKFVKNVLMGCDGKIDRILWSQQYEYERNYTISFKGENFAISLRQETKEPITDELLVKEYEEMKKYEAELERQELERKIKERRI